MQRNSLAEDPPGNVREETHSPSAVILNYIKNKTWAREIAPFLLFYGLVKETTFVRSTT